jgi:Cys-rich protein (TIGR01571 family)
MNYWSNTIICARIPVETCVLSALFPMCQYGHNVQKFKLTNNEISPSWIPYTFGYFGSYVIGGLIFILYANIFANFGNLSLNPDIINTFGNVGGSICLGAYAGKFRTELREKYNIEGSQFTDCIIHSVMSPCALCQEAEEIEIRHNENNFYGNGIMQAPYIPVMTKE